MIAPVQPADLRAASASRPTRSGAAGLVQDLVGVDVADAGDDVWSSSSGFSCRAPAGAAAAASCGDVRPSASGSMPRWASSGSSTSTWSGSNTTTSPNVRGSTNRSSSAGVAVEVSTTWVCGGRCAPAGATQQLAAHAQVDHQRVAGVEREQQVLAAPVDGDDLGAGQAVDQLPARDVRRTVRSPADLDALDAPADDVAASPRRTVSTSGSSGIERQSARRRAASHASDGGRLLGRFFDRPSPSPERRAVDHAPWRRTLGVVGPSLGERRTPARRRTAAAASSCSRVLWSSRSSWPAAVVEPLAEQPLDERRRRRRRRRRGRRRRSPPRARRPGSTASRRPPAASSPLPSSRHVAEAELARRPRPARRRSRRSCGPRSARPRAGRGSAR